MNAFKKIFLFLLILCAFFCTLSVVANSNDEQLSFENYKDEIAYKSNFYSSFEIVSLREEYAKHFKMNDGTYRMVVYSNPIHKKTESGKWIDRYNYSFDELVNGTIFEPLRIPPGWELPFDPQTDIGLYDTYVSSSNPATNYGSSINMQISSDGTKIALLKSLMYSIPAESTITNSYYRFLYYFTSSNSKSMVIGAYEVLSDWQENSVSWNSGVSLSATRLSTYLAYDSATMLSPSYAQLDITQAALSWYSGHTDNYGIAIKYESGDATTMLIKTRENSGFHTSLIVDYSLSPIIIDNGNYYIINGNFEKYAQVATSDSINGFVSEGAAIELQNGDGYEYQRWSFEYLHNGYYKIKSLISGKVISVQYGFEGSSLYSLDQETYTGSYRQQWCITQTTSGKYKVKPRSSEIYNADFVMCAATNGLSVYQYLYINDNDFNDEWIIEELDSEIITLCGVYTIDSMHDHSTCIENTMQKFFNAGYNNINMSVDYYTTDTILNYLNVSKILIIRSHGGTEYISGVGNYSFIDLNEMNNTSLFSIECEQMNGYSAYIPLNADYSNLDLVVFAGCLTGVGGNNNVNLPSVVVNRGAKAAIGFYTTIDCQAANDWVEEFVELLISGYTVQNAVSNASNDIGCGTQFYVIVGDGSYTLGG